MKKLLALVFCVIFSFTLISLASCDYQEAVDSARSNLMETAKDLLDPLLNQSGSSSASSSSAGSQPSTDTSDIK